MPTPTAPGCIEAVLQAVQFGTERFTVFNFAGTAPHPTLGEMTAAGGVIIGAVNAHLGVFHSSVSFVNVRVTDRSQVAGPIVDVPFGAGVVGTASDPPLPGNVAAVVTMRTNTGGRSGHGRVYMFGLVGGHIVPGDLTTGAYRTAALAYIQKIIDDGAVADVFLSVFSRKHGALYQVTTLVMDQLLDSQRRRLPGRGR